ncbi:MAG TPA: hypothetical protein VKD24_05920 [Candidatus Angelobacter sp.]|nr:hypothetical protein [Candidatus Angelobacter sp.]
MKKNYFDADNRRAAEIILADPEKYAGLPLIWAELWMKNHPQASAAEEEAQRKAAGREPASVPRAQKARA